MSQPLGRRDFRFGSYSVDLNVSFAAINECQREQAIRAVSAAPRLQPTSTLRIALPIPISAAPEISPAQIGSSPSTQKL